MSKQQTKVFCKWKNQFRKYWFFYFIYTFRLLPGIYPGPYITFFSRTGLTKWPKFWPVRILRILFFTLPTYVFVAFFNQLWSQICSDVCKKSKKPSVILFRSVRVTMNRFLFLFFLPVISQVKKNISHYIDLRVIFCRISVPLFLCFWILTHMIVFKTPSRFISFHFRKTK